MRRVHGGRPRRCSGAVRPLLHVWHMRAKARDSAVPHVPRQRPARYGRVSVARRVGCRAR